MPSTLAEFIQAAKQSTYAALGDAASAPPLLPGTQQLEFSSGEYLYRDIYAGMNFFVGKELVYKSGIAMWGMSYSGGVTGSTADAAVSEIYRFLRTALLQAPAHLPLRGPATLCDGPLEYACDVTGDLTRFRGTERICISGHPAYELHFSGGTLAES